MFIKRNKVSGEFSAYNYNSMKRIKLVELDAVKISKILSKD